MEILCAIRSELIKVRHTSFWKIHTMIPFVGAIIFVLYFFLYANVNRAGKLNLILELTLLVFPLMISIVTGANILQEERTSHFHVLLAAPHRRQIFVAKLFVLYGAGCVGLFVLYCFFLLGLFLLGQWGVIDIGILIGAVMGIALENLIMYTFHLFLSFKFGMGISLLCGVFEMLQLILYSNIELKGAVRYIPFAWPVEWVHDIMNQVFWQNMIQWVMTFIFTTGFICIIAKWFQDWEGRKNYE